MSEQDSDALKERARQILWQHGIINNATIALVMPAMLQLSAEAAHELHVCRMAFGGFDQGHQSAYWRLYPNGSTSARHSNLTPRLQRLRP